MGLRISSRPTNTGGLSPSAWCRKSSSPLPSKSRLFECRVFLARQTIQVGVDKGHTGAFSGNRLSYGGIFGFSVPSNAPATCGSAGRRLAVGARSPSSRGRDVRCPERLSGATYRAAGRECPGQRALHLRKIRVRTPTTDSPGSHRRLPELTGFEINIIPGLGK